MKKFTLLFVLGVGSLTITAQNLPVKGTNSAVIFETVSVGINEVSLESSITVFPIPASNELTVKVAEGYSIGTCELFIYDITGKSIAHEKNVSFKNGNLSVDVKNLNNGIYTLVLNPKDNKVAINKRFVVSR